MLMFCLYEVNSSSIAKNATILARLSRVTASPVGHNQSALASSDAFSGHGLASISLQTPPNAPHSHNTSPSSCCFVVQDTIDARYWVGG